MSRFGNPVSGYVDYKFEEVGNVRRERYLNNFYASEAVRQSAADLEAAPFEGDKAYREQLLKNTDDVLNNIAEQGDYENLTLAVSRASTGYQKRAKALTQNKAQYDAYQTGLKELYDEGKIDYEDYQGTLGLARQGYTGLQTDESGNAVNFFDPDAVVAVQNPDINKMLKEALNGMKADGDTVVRRVVGYGPNGELEVETEQGREYITPERVQNAMRSVMEDRRVVDYIGRKAKIRTAFMDDKTAAEELNGNIEIMKETAGQLDELIAESRTDEQKQAYIDQKERLMNNMGRVQGVLEQGDGSKMRDELASVEANKIFGMYESSTKSKYSFVKTTDKQKEFHDKLHLQLQQQGFDLQQSMNPISFEGNMVQYKNPYGTSDVEASQNRAILSTKHEAAVQLLNNLPEDADAALVEQYLGGVRQIENDIRALDDYTQFRYGQVSAAVMQTPEYQALTDEIVEAEAKYNDLVENEEYAVYEGSQQAYYWNKIADLREKRMDMLKEQVTEDPLGADIETTFSYANAQKLPQFRGSAEAMKRGKEIDSAIKTYFEAIPDDFMIYIPGRTGQGEMVSYGEARGAVEPSSSRNVKVPESMMIPEDAKYASHGISMQAPTSELGATIQINYTSEEGGNGSYIVPLNQAIKIPQLSQHLNTPIMKVYGEVERYGRGNVVGMERTIPYTGSAGPGKMKITYLENGPVVQFIGSNGITTETKSLDSPEVHEIIQGNNIRI